MTLRISFPMMSVDNGMIGFSGQPSGSPYVA